MREILFRGKTIANNSIWVEGFYNRIPCGRFLCDEHLIQTIDNDGKIGQLFTVYDSTVCQFTGLTDKNGKKIFEGDILKRTNGNKYLWYVDFKLSAFCANQSNCNYSCKLGELLEMIEAEVIGNIYDNPELLEVENGN